MAEHCGEHTIIIAEVMYPYFDKHARWLMSFTCKFMRAMYLADTPNAYPSERSVLRTMVGANNIAGIEWVAAFRGALPNNAPKSTDRGWWCKKQYKHFSRWGTYKLHKVPDVSMDTLVYLTEHGMPRKWIHPWLVWNYNTVAERRLIAKRFGVVITNRTKETDKTLRAHATKSGLVHTGITNRRKTLYAPATNGELVRFGTREQNILRGLMKSHRISDACVFCTRIDFGICRTTLLGKHLFWYMLKYGIPLDGSVTHARPLMSFAILYARHEYDAYIQTPFSVINKALRYDFSIPMLKNELSHMGRSLSVYDMMCITFMEIARGIHHQENTDIPEGMWKTMWSVEYAGIWHAMSVDICLEWLLFVQQHKKIIARALYRHIATQMSAANLLALYNKHREYLDINLLVMHAESAEFLGLCMDSGLPIIAGGWHVELPYMCYWSCNMWRVYSKYVSYEDAFAVYTQRPRLGATMDTRILYGFERAYGFPAKNKKHAHFLLNELIAKQGIDGVFTRLLA